jgi:hypothetical protein
MFTNKPARQSLEAFKANAAAVQTRESIEKITGGLMDDCHKPIKPF